MIVRFMLLCHLFNVVLIGPLTLSQLALLVMFSMIAHDIFVEKRLIIDTAAYSVLFVTGALLLAVVAMGIAAHIGGSPIDGDAIKRLLSWLFIWISIVFGYRHSEALLGIGALQFYISVATVITMFLVFQIVTIGPGAIETLRLSLQGILPNGLNGFFLSLLCLQALSFCALLVPGISLQYKMLAVFSLTVPFIANLLLGSRQYAVGFVLMVLIVVARTGTLREKVRRVSAVLVFVGIFAALVLASGDLFEASITDRVEQSQRQAESGSDRLIIWLSAIDLIDGWPFIGSGVGHASKAVGRYIDNFYLEFVIDYGLIALVLLLACAGVLFRAARRAIKFGSPTSESYIVIHAFLLSAFFWFAIFNEVVREYFLWNLLGALIGLGVQHDVTARQRTTIGSVVINE